MPTDEKAPSASTRRLYDVAENRQHKPADMVNGMQVRAARALLGWDQQELATRAGIAVRSLSAFEDQSRQPIARVRMALVTALLNAGIEFVTRSDAVGVLLRVDVEDPRPASI